MWPGCKLSLTYSDMSHAWSVVLTASRQEVLLWRVVVTSRLVVTHADACILPADILTMAVLSPCNVLQQEDGYDEEEEASDVPRAWSHEVKTQDLHQNISHEDAGKPAGLGPLGMAVPPPDNSLQCTLLGR